MMISKALFIRWIYDNAVVYVACRSVSAAWVESNRLAECQQPNLSCLVDDDGMKSRPRVCYGTVIPQTCF